MRLENKLNFLSSNKLFTIKLKIQQTTFGVKEVTAPTKKIG
jgi:hypothetical protein